MKVIDLVNANNLIGDYVYVYDCSCSKLLIFTTLDSPFIKTYNDMEIVEISCGYKNGVSCFIISIRR